MNKYLLTLIIPLFSLTGCIDSEEIGKVRPVETAIIADYIAKWQPTSEEIIQDGAYFASFSMTKSSEYLTANTTYIFENGYMSYESKIHGRYLFVIPLNFSFSGKAKYKAKNGLLTFDDVTGDGALFPLYPTPYEVVNQGDTIIIHELNNEGDINLLHLTRLKK
ncbi:TPA: hypothetical protein JG825_003456 [Vibrio parahaemolyticus]|nr:hypothetical protein [Vibrio parahaemolyticus]UPR19082.1 hypothetical protein H9J99_25900 [Vibrio parahaemolyticus]HAV1520137.1 hypothetical protein [Vibrio parahaemolyticus]HAV1539104.1 hypothetical protein [Vibrio parahaemolyticus]